MALIAMAVHDTEENGRSELTEKTLNCLMKTVDWAKHRLIVVDNGSKHKNGISQFANLFNSIRWELIILSSNIGTAKAINLAWKQRRPGEHCIKMDNDVVINSLGWVDEMEQTIQREPQIGIVALKRKDLWECPWHPEKHYRSELMMLPHEPGERWVIVERVRHVMGTCQMYNSALLDKIGYLYQPSLYGYDDTLSSYRSEIAGFINVFLPHIDIDHIDPGGTDYTEWKKQEAAEHSQDIVKIVDDYISGKRPIYEDA